MEENKKAIIGFKGTKFERTINKIKNWTKENFIFNKNTVYYSTYEDVEYINPLPKELRTEEDIYRKSDFDTPLSHLMYILLVVGRKMQIEESMMMLEAMIDNPAGYTFNEDDIVISKSNNI